MRSLGQARLDLIDALVAEGEDTEKAASLNERRYMHSQWSYARAYGGASGLRPNLQLELTTRSTVLPTVRCTLVALTDRLAGRDGGAFRVETVSVAKTQAEKVLSFLRRFAQHRSGQMQRDWDTALVRHIYDVHCIHTHQPGLVEESSLAFADLVHGDAKEFGKQQPDFAKNPFHVLRGALEQAKTDGQTRAEYEQNLLPLVYGNLKPHFDEAFATFELVALGFLVAADRAK